MSDFNNNGKPAYKISIKSGLQLLIGLAYIAIACYMLIKHQFGTAQLSPGISYSIGSLLIIYGLFRIWRSIQDMKTYEDQ